jgi:hypothetical protein
MTRTKQMKMMEGTPVKNKRKTLRGNSYGKD